MEGIPGGHTQRQPVVRTDGGTIRGITVDSVSVFRGVPYGKDAGGHGRFLPTEPARWAGIRDTVNYGHTAPQRHPGAKGVPPHLTWIFDSEPRSEDCLVLNVYAPAEDAVSQLPVMVYFHGGGFAFGSASPPGLDATNLAKQGVVVVTINHRLNILGHLYLGGHHTDYQDSGNVGLLDILSTLRWVQRNIAQFGGDPDCVTIFGQSGGGSKVAALMTMPAAKGLFHRAIIQSASSMLHFSTPEEATLNAVQVLKELKIDEHNVHKLGLVPTQALLDAIPHAMASCGKRDYFRPIIDGFHLLDQPFTADSLSLSSTVPLLIGWCETEQRASFSLTPEVFDQTRSTALARLTRFLDISHDQAAAVMDTYASSRPGDSPGDLMSMIYGDQRYRRTVTHAAERRSIFNQGPTYLYTIKWRSQAMDGLLRSPHMMCLPFVFRNVDRAPHFVGTDPDRYRLQDEISQRWITFARTGKPEGSSAAWPPYNLQSRPTMVFDRESHVQNDPAADERSVLDLCPPYDPAEAEGGKRG